MASKSPSSCHWRTSPVYFVCMICLMSSTTVLANSRLIVHSPESLRRVSPQGFNHEEAMFGKRVHGRSIIQPLYYADSDFCNPQDDRLSPPIQYYPTKPFDSSHPFLLMVNRGGECNFVRKVRNAQHMGAAGVIIADTKCVCKDYACLEEWEEQGEADPTLACQRREPIMRNDGSGGHDITIPSVLLWKRDADLFKRTIMQGNQTIQVEMQYPPQTETAPGFSPAGYRLESSTVDLELWMNPADTMSVNLITRFQPVALAFSKHLNFTLHMSLIDGVKTGCQESEQMENEQSHKSNCFNLCTNQGRYCAIDPDDEDESYHRVTGADVVTESLRQLCIWSQDDGTGKGVFWWRYIQEFYENCLPDQRFHDSQCAKQIYKKVGIDETAVNNCMKHSGGLEGKGINRLLEEELEVQRHYGIHVLPTINVDRAPFDVRPLTGDALFQVVCNHLKYSEMPKDSHERRLCHRCGSLECTDFSGCVANNGVCPDSLLREAAVQHSTKFRNGGKSSTNQGVSVLMFLSSILGLVAVTALVGIWHYKRSRAVLKDQVRGIISDYMLLDSSGDEDTMVEIPQMQQQPEQDTHMALSPPSASFPGGASEAAGEAGMPHH